MNEQLEGLMTSFMALGAEAGVTYVSVPISSGERELQVLHKLHCTRAELYTRFKSVWTRDVLIPNQKDAHRLVAAVRRRYPSQIVVDPAHLTVEAWGQTEYNNFWANVIRRFGRRLVLASGWALSRGSRRELDLALKLLLPIENDNGREYTIGELVSEDTRAHEILWASTLDETDKSNYLEPITAFEGREVGERQAYVIRPNTSNVHHYKDAVLDSLAANWNVAQFISFAPDGLQQRFCRVAGLPPNHRFGSPEAGAAYLLDRSVDHSVNVRSFRPDQPKGNEFIYGLRELGAAVGHLRRLSQLGLYTILNETVDVMDGGVSGVVHGESCEFAPDDTPRSVEKPGTTSVRTKVAEQLLETVYGFPIRFAFPSNARVEFSLHPLVRGYLQQHLIVWELEENESPYDPPPTVWPTRFSRFLGDKTFGLLLGHVHGLPVPLTTVICRRIRPFTFGLDTTRAELWIRTAPIEQVPGHYTSIHGWTDPFKLLADEDPSGDRVPALLIQQSVDAAFSGAVLTTQRGDVIVEGVAGPGDSFMLGKVSPEPLPTAVLRAVDELYKDAVARFRLPVRMEWAFDGRTAWLIQLHAGASSSGIGAVIYEGKALKYRQFETILGLERLRELIPDLKRTGDGIILVGDVGVTSHFGDLLRREHISSRIQRTATGQESASGESDANHRPRRSNNRTSKSN